MADEYIKIKKKILTDRINELKEFKKQTTMENGLNHLELSALAKELENFEAITLMETGVKKLSGGFAIAEMFNYDNDIIDVELKWGVQDEGGGDTHVEMYKIDRKTMKFLN